MTDEGEGIAVDPVAPVEGEQDQQPEKEGGDDTQARLEALEEDKRRLQTALHKERQAKKAKPESADLEAKMNEISAQLAHEKREKVVAQFTDSQEETELAMSYFDKLAGAETDPTKLSEVAKKAALLARADKNPGVNPALRAGSAMHSGGRSANESAEVSQATQEIGRFFGHGADKLKEYKNRATPNNLYSKR